MRPAASPQHQSQTRPHKKSKAGCLSVVVHAESLQSCPTLYDPMDCSLPGTSVHGILQTRILEWVAMPSSRASYRPRDWACVSYIFCIGRRVLYHWCLLGSPACYICYQAGLKMRAWTCRCWRLQGRFGVNRWLWSEAHGARQGQEARCCNQVLPVWEVLLFPSNKNSVLGLFFLYTLWSNNEEFSLGGKAQLYLLILASQVCYLIKI